MPRTSGALGLVLLLLLAAAPLALAALKPAAPRNVLALDGTWQIEQGGLEATPDTFSHTVVVPGLVDMAQPAFDEVGKKSALRQAFWYRRTFTVNGPVPEIAILKLHKARYGAKVFLNGAVVGEHLPCFTPAYFTVKDALKGAGQTNELLIRIGANRESLPEGMPTGWDFEKYLFLPGIYDSVELILTGAPYIQNVQVVPDLEAKTVRVVAEVLAGSAGGNVRLKAEVADTGLGRQAGAGEASASALGANELKVLDFTVPLRNCRFWSPENPVLYQLKLSTGADAATTRFGMRTFRFDPATKRALLNGKTYFLRGSNVTIYRFFEDAERQDRPWRAEWVRRLHEKFKTMHWNALRYCIGFPPESWYDIADEEGFLIQDEFPIWLLDKAPENPRAEKIIPEYTEWMRERWNHPCVVIWDAQNESHTDQTGKALQAVRQLDLSNRPWENGWAEPQSPTDCVEAHPYLFIRGWSGKDQFRMSQMTNVSGIPNLTAAQKKLPAAIIINEYAWLWLTRDGNPTCLTDKIYASLLGPDSTADQRRALYAKYLAAKTEFWRSHRECAGVLHFCGLGYSRPGDKPRPEGGATSDHFIDLEKLTFEPNFEKYVRDAFNPLGVMLDFWAEELPAGGSQIFKVRVINDFEKEWRGRVRLQVLQGGKTFSNQMLPCTVAGFGRESVTFTQATPAQPGDLTLVAEAIDHKGQPVRSYREVKVVEAR